MGRLLARVFVAAAAVVTVFPFYWMVRTALTPAGDLFTDNFRLWPEHPTPVNFARVVGLGSVADAQAAGGSGARLDFLLYLRNSATYTTIVVAAQTLSCAMAAYALARLRFRGRRAVFGLFVGALMVPPIFTLLPNFALVKSLGLLDSFAGLVLPALLMTPFSVFFLRQFFLSIPVAVEEAALLDGAGRWTVFWRIALPIAKGPLFAQALTLSVWTWKDYLWPLLVAPGDDTRVLTAALGVFLQQAPNSRPDWTGLMAASTLTVIPVLVLLGFFGKRMVNAITFTGTGKE